MKITLHVYLLDVAFVFLIRSIDSKASPSKNLFENDELNSSAQGNEKLPNYRLPNETYPEHYDIKIATDLHLGERSFQGEVAIDIIVSSSTSSVILHARQIEISEAIILNRITGKVEELSYEYELEREFLILKRKRHKPFQAGTKWKLIITYRGQLSDDLRGFYSFNYIDENGQNRLAALTHFESTNARLVFPCYDEPSKRARFTITIIHSPDFTAISNMPVNEKLSGHGKTVFLTTPRMPTYILAFVIGDFEYTELIFNGIRHRVYSRPSRKSDQLFSLTNGILYTDYLSKYYGIDYMLPKLDHVAVPQHKAAGMENWGLAIYPEKNLLCNRKIFLEESKTAAAKNVAHEVAHQWFGNYVTIKWWSNLWLKESFATLFAYKAMENVFPEWSVCQDFHVSQYQSALEIDAAFDSRPITAYAQKPSDIAGVHDEIAYYKSTSVLIMWQNALGEEVFRRALQNFFKNYQYSAASEEDLFIEMEKSAEEYKLKLSASISEMMKTWTHQGGYPILTVTRNYTDGSFTVKQEAFFNEEIVENSKAWYVPLNFASASKIDFHDTKATHYLPDLSELKVDAKLPSHDWIVLNKQSEYFYRIRYDEENYKLITKTLIEQPFKIPVRNRAQLLNDAVHLSFSNRLSHEIVWHMLTYVKKEDQYAPWQNVNEVIFNYRKLKDFLIFNRFVIDLVRPIFNKLGVNEIPGEHHNDKYIRNTVIGIACRAGLEECLVETNKKVNDFVTRNITIEPDIEIQVLSRGLELANDIEFDFYYQKFIKSENAIERLDLIYYLSFVQNEQHIKQLISSSIDTSNKLQSNERIVLFESVYNKREKSLLACIEFLNENWDAYGNLGDANDDKPLESAIRGMAKNVFKRKAEQKLLGLVAKVKDSKHVSKSLKLDVQHDIDENCQWLQKHGYPTLLWISRTMRMRCKQSKRDLFNSPTFCASMSNLNK